MRLNGCHDRPPFRRVTPVQDGWFLDGDTRVPRMAPAPHRMTTDCQYTRTKLGQADAGCDGCKHRMIDQATPEKLNGATVKTDS